MFQKVMTGGACQASDQASQMNQNAATQMADALISGDAQAFQRAEGHVMIQNPQQIENMMAMQQ